MSRGPERLYPGDPLRPRPAVPSPRRQRGVPYLCCGCSDPLGAGYGRLPRGARQHPDPVGSGPPALGFLVRTLVQGCRGEQQGQGITWRSNGCSSRAGLRERPNSGLPMDPILDRPRLDLVPDRLGQVIEAPPTHFPTWAPLSLSLNPPHLHCPSVQAGAAVLFSCTEDTRRRATSCCQPQPPVPASPGGRPQPYHTAALILASPRGLHQLGSPLPGRGGTEEHAIPASWARPRLHAGSSRVQRGRCCCSCKI